MPGINRVYYWKRKPHVTQMEWLCSAEVGQTLVWFNDFSDASFKFLKQNAERAGLVIEWNPEQIKIMFKFPEGNEEKSCTIYEGVVVAKYTPPKKKDYWEAALQEDKSYNPHHSNWI